MDDQDKYELLDKMLKQINTLSGEVVDLKSQLEKGISWEDLKKIKLTVILRIGAISEMLDRFFG